MRRHSCGALEPWTFSCSIEERWRRLESLSMHNVTTSDEIFSFVITRHPAERPAVTCTPSFQVPTGFLQVPTGLCMELLSSLSTSSSYTPDLCYCFYLSSALQHINKLALCTNGDEARVRGVIAMDLHWLMSEELHERRTLICFYYCCKLWPMASIAPASGIHEF